MLLPLASPLTRAESAEEVALFEYRVLVQDFVITEVTVMVMMRCNASLGDDGRLKPAMRV